MHTMELAGITADGLCILGRQFDQSLVIAGRGVFGGGKSFGGANNLT